MEVGQYLFPVVLVAFLSRSGAEPNVSLITTPYGLTIRENMKGTIGLTLSWCVFAGIIFLILFQLYMRHCYHDLAAAAGGGFNRDAIDKCPVFVYSTAKELKMGKGAAECAVCLSEFEERDTIKMLPKCEHVFHQHCIDAWLPSRMNCPICRQNLTSQSESESDHNDSVVDIIDVPTNSPTEQQELGSTTQSEVAEPEPETERQSVVGHARESRRLGRSFSTGHSIVGHDVIERFSLRLPEHVVANGGRGVEFEEY